LKVVTYVRQREERAGILVDDAVYDVQASAEFLGTGPMQPGLLGILDAGLFGDLRATHAGLIEARRARTGLPLGCWADVKEVRLVAPLPRPPKLICLGLNYRDHAEEQGARLPEVPLIFAKAPTAVVGPGQPIVIPPDCENVDYEAELAVVVARRLKRATPEEAQGGIFGYTCLNDVSERAIQKERVWFRAKSIDTFAPLGPWIVTADDLANVLDLKITTRVNSRVMQSGSTSNLIFKPVDLVVFISRYITLEPGDIISTGTPSGVGVFRKPPVFLKHGDVVEITVEGIGTLTNPVVKEA